MKKILRWRIVSKLFYVILVIALLLLSSSYFFPQFKLYPPAGTHLPQQQHVSRHLSRSITVVFRQYEEFENDIADSVQSFVSAFPNMRVLVICKNTPYPPLPFSLKNDSLHNVKILPLEFQLQLSPQDLNPLAHIDSDYVLFAPDSVRVSKRVLQQAASVATLSQKAVAIGVGNAKLICLQVTWEYVKWSLEYHKDDSMKECDAVQGQHALLLKTGLLRDLPQPFMMPFPESLYLQTSVRHIKTHLLATKFPSGRSVLKTALAKQRAARYLRENRVSLYKSLGVKVVTREDGRLQWFGCKKETQRCFPPVRGVPSFVLAGRHTPPCCLRHVRRAALHALRTLAAAGARCWLETTTLLGAVVHGDLVPHAEYAEIGVHAADAARVALLARGGADADGFVWERATRGRYYSVAYSANNRVYAIVLPFAARNGTMTPLDWVFAHQRAFPERHLHPLAQIPFAGRSAPAPNNAGAFLDRKLGPAAVQRYLAAGPALLYPRAPRPPRAPLSPRAPRTPRRVTP